MANNTNKPTKAGDVSDSLKKTSTRASAEEKLKKSLKNLSYTSGTSGGSTASTTSRSSSTTKKDDRKKVGGVVLDVETIQDATKQKFETKGRRKNVIILILVLALVVSLVFVAISVLNYQKSKKAPNLKYTIQGDAGSLCSWVVGEGSQTKFVLKEGLSTGMAYMLTSSLDVKTPLSVNITIEIIALLDGTPIQVALSYEGDNTETFTKVDDETKNIFTYNGTTHSGGGKLKVFDGIDFTDAPYNLTSENIEIEVIAKVEFV
ncbi:MAG: hypothetical protein IJA72_00780 [Clostridia bacterium]|nr:hypothetical protein [Clostridia bacterium]